MRHRVAGRHFGRDSSHRISMYRNLITDLLRYERITTTEAKCKEIRPMTERVITLGKRGDLHARRQALKVVIDPGVVEHLFDNIAPRMADRPGGYLRITKLEPRKGDGASMATIELVDFVDAPPTPRPQRVTAAPVTPVAAAPAAPAATAQAVDEVEADVAAPADEAADVAETVEAEVETEATVAAKVEAEAETEDAPEAEAETETEAEAEAPAEAGAEESKES